MGRVLILNGDDYPDKLLGKDCPTECSSREELEEKLLSAINSFNPKLNVSRVEYSINKDVYDLAKSSRYLGIIADEHIIPNSVFENETVCFDWLIHDEGITKTVYRPIVYMLITPSSEEGRNVLFTQQVFPILIDLIKCCIHSSSYNPGNHPIYLLNVINKDITAPTLLRRLTALSMMGIEVVDVFHKTLDHSTMPKNLHDLCVEYYSNDYLDGVTETKDFRISEADKTIILKTDHWVEGDYIRIKSGSRDHEVHGSDEKFYWIEVIPTLLIAINEGYSFDYSAYRHFINDEIARDEGRFTTGEKFKRMRVLLDYFDKLALLKDE